MRRRIASSGRGPEAAARFSTTCLALRVPGITQVTAGWARIHLRKNCAQLALPVSCAQSGRGRPFTRANMPPSAKGRFTRTAVPLSAAARRSRRSAPGAGGGLGERVVHLHEVDVAAPDDLLELGVAARMVVGHADIAEAARGLPVAKGGELGLHVDQVVHLHQIETLDAEPTHGLFHLTDA